MHITPKKSRIQFEEVSGETKAFIPAKRNWFVILFLSFWLCAWLFGELSALNQLVNSEDQEARAFLIFWILGWTVGGAFAGVCVFWQISGREIITVSEDTFAHRIEVFGLGRERLYRKLDVKELRFSPSTFSPFTHQLAWMPPIIGSGWGAIAFDYGASTLRIGGSLEEAEAKLLVDKLAKKI